MIISPKSIETFYARIDRIPTVNGCRIWIGKTRNGYGRFTIRYNGRRIAYSAHRCAWIINKKFIPPKGLQIHHICRNGLCCNVDHMILITQAEHNLLDNNVAAINKRKTMCKRGHPLSGDNLIIDRRGKRQCKICTRLRNRILRSKMTEAQKRRRRELGRIRYRKNHPNAKLHPSLRINCPLGHSYENNTYFEKTKTGRLTRHCKICRNLRQKLLRLRKGLGISSKSMKNLRIHGLI